MKSRMVTMPLGVRVLGPWHDTYLPMRIQEDGTF